MNDHAWFKSFCGEDYFEIYRDAFPAEHTAAQVDGIVSLLGLDTGARVLDLACGHGRHAILLAKRGFDVTGYDLSEVFLARARADAEAEGVTNIFTAFGYFEDPEDDVKTLRAIWKALRPGGRFLLETLHRDGLPAASGPRSPRRSRTARSCSTSTSGTSRVT